MAYNYPDHVWQWYNHVNSNNNNQTYSGPAGYYDMSNATIGSPDQGDPGYFPPGAGVLSFGNSPYGVDGRVWSDQSFSQQREEAMGRVQFRPIPLPFVCPVRGCGLGYTAQRALNKHIIEKHH